MIICRWCDHPMTRHSNYYGGWCSADVTVVGDPITPAYTLSCWCGGTEDTAGPREVTSLGSKKLIPDGNYWRVP